MTDSRRPPAFNVPSADPQAARGLRRNLREAKTRLIAVKRHRQKKLVRAQAQVDHQTAKIAGLEVRLERVAQAAKVLDEGWEAWRPDPNAPAYRATPLPRGALSKGALTVLRRAGRPMTSKEITVAIFEFYGFPCPPPATLGVIAVRVTGNLARKSEGPNRIVRRERHWGGHVWSIILLSEIRSNI